MNMNMNINMKHYTIHSLIKVLGTCRAFPRPPHPHPLPEVAQGKDRAS